MLKKMALSLLGIVILILTMMCIPSKAVEELEVEEMTGTNLIQQKLGANYTKIEKYKTGSIPNYAYCAAKGGTLHANLDPKTTIRYIDISGTYKKYIRGAYPDGYYTKLYAKNSKRLLAPNTETARNKVNQILSTPYLKDAVTYLFAIPKSDVTQNYVWTKIVNFGNSVNKNNRAEAKRLKKEIEEYHKIYMATSDSQKATLSANTSNQKAVQEGQTTIIGPLSINYYRYNLNSDDQNLTVPLAGIGTVRDNSNGYRYPQGDSITGSQASGSIIKDRYEFNANSYDAIQLYDVNGNLIDKSNWNIRFVDEAAHDRYQAQYGDTDAKYAAPYPNEEFYIEVNNGIIASKMVVTSYYTKMDLVYLTIYKPSGTPRAQELLYAEVEINYPTNTIEIPLEEPKQYEGEISGTVWLDAETGKALEANGLMEIQPGGDSALAGVNVYLYKVGETVPIKGPVKSDDNGQYRFTNLPEGEYYVVFEYDGMTLSTTKIVDAINGSKAEENINDRIAFNNKFNEIRKDVAIGTGGENTALDYEFTMGSENTLAESSLITKLNGEDVYKITAKTINNITLSESGGMKVGNINLGLAERFESDFAIMQDITKSEVYYQGNLIKEETYNKRNQNSLTNIELTAEELLSFSKELAVSANTLSAYRAMSYSLGLSEIFDEGAKTNANLGQQEMLANAELYLSYKIVVLNQSEQATGRVNEILEHMDSGYSLVEITDGDGNAIANYTIDGNTIRISGLGDKELAPNRIMELHLKFKVDLPNIFANTQTVSKVCTAEISSYSFNTNSQDNNYIKFVNARIDRDSQPENVDLNNIYSYEDDTDSAPRIGLSIVEGRKVSGFVWEDVNKDGIKDGSEPVIPDVTVQLKNENTVVSSTTTGEDGSYQFKDLAAGNYQVEFRYGDTVEGVKLKNGKSYNGQAFESTIVGIDSHAVDNAARRAEVINNCKIINKEIATILTSPYANPLVEADLQRLVEIAYMTAQTDQISVLEIHDNATTRGINLGLKERPATKVTVDKRVKEIKVTLTTGEVFAHVTIDENGNKTSLEGYDVIKQVPASNLNEGSYEIELAEELTNGANVEIKYDIIVKNESEQGSVRVTKLFDYISDGARFESEGSSTNWVILTEDERKASVYDSVDNNVIVSTDALKDTVLEVGQTATAEITVKAELSSAIRALNYVNVSEVGEYETETGTKDPETDPGDKEGHDTGTSEEIIVHPPTGTTPTYYLLALVILLIFINGIILIRKKAINK